MIEYYENDKNSKKIHKLKVVKLKALLYNENFKIKNANKSHKFFPKFKTKISYSNSPNPLLYTHNNFHKNLFKCSSIRYYENSKKANKPLTANLPSISNDIKSKKKNYNYNYNTINIIEGYNNYLKEKSNKAYMRMNRLLLEETLKRLAIPKFQKSKRRDKTNSDKSKYLSNKDLLDDDFLNGRKRTIKKKEISLFEKEKIRTREKFNFLLKNKFKQLDTCEKKFDLVIDKTLKLLNDYKISLQYLKKEE